MMLEPRQQIESLQAVDAQRLEEVIVGSELFPGHFEMQGCKFQDFIESVIKRRYWHRRSVLRLQITNDYLQIHGKYGCTPSFSTNFRSPSSTAGREQRSQKISISRFNS